jgi:Homeodomain
MMYELLLPQSHMPFPNVSSSIAAAAAAAAVSQGSDDLASSTIYTNTLFDTFHQMPHGDFKPTFYNPFEIKHRRRTSRAQFKVLERTFMENPKPSAAVRRILAQKLNMTPRGVQVWFQNRRAKAKLQKQQDEKQRLEGSLQDPSSPASSGLGYSSPSTSSQGSISSPSKETKKAQNEDMYSAFSAKIPFSQTTATNNLHDETASLSPRFRADGNAWFNFPSTDFQTHQFHNFSNATSPIEHSAPGPLRVNSMRCRPAANYSMPYNAGLLRRKSCPGDLVNTMYTNMTSSNREKLQDIPEDVVPNTSFLVDNMNCYMNSMQVTIKGLKTIYL